MSTTTTARHFADSCIMLHSLLEVFGVRGLGIQEEPATASVLFGVNAFGLS